MQPVWTLKQLDLTLKQLDFTLKQLDLALKQLDSTLKQLDLALKQLDSTLKQLDSTLKQLDLTLKQLVLALLLNGFGDFSLFTETAVLDRRYSLRESGMPEIPSLRVASRAAHRHAAQFSRTPAAPLFSVALRIFLSRFAWN
ncbi:MAG: hypothetical protein ACTHKU_04585 [Verrucomicrobiota bacterium]